MKITSAPLTFDLADGSPSVKDYIMGPDRRLNRFSTASTAKKNRIVGPTKVLHFFGIPKCDEDVIAEFFVEHEAPRPNKVKWVETKKEKEDNLEKSSGGQGNGVISNFLRTWLVFIFQVGLAYFDTKDEALTALVLVNHQEIEVATIWIHNMQYNTNIQYHLIRLIN